MTGSYSLWKPGLLTWDCCNHRVGCHPVKLRFYIVRMNKALVELPKTKDKCKNPCCQPKVTYTLAPFFHGTPTCSWHGNYPIEHRSVINYLIFYFVFLRHHFSLYNFHTPGKTFCTRREGKSNLNNRTKRLSEGGYS